MTIDLVLLPEGFTQSINTSLHHFFIKGADGVEAKRRRRNTVEDSMDMVYLRTVKLLRLGGLTIKYHVYIRISHDMSKDIRS